MKYERLTTKRENGFATVRNTTLQGLIDRLAELEDKIESGELCDRDEVRKETAKKIIYRLRNLSHVGHLRSELDLLCREYCIEENKE